MAESKGTRSVIFRLGKADQSPKTSQLAVAKYRVIFIFYIQLQLL